MKQDTEKTECFSWPLRQVTIVGVGLLGGSLGLALKKFEMAEKIVGLGRSIENLERAKSFGCFDIAETDPASALKKADVVILCQPVSAIVDFMPTCFEWIPDGAIVTDVGSTKVSIVAAGEKVCAKRGGGTAFVGSHPMAGSERSGAKHARANLFCGATCHVTVTARSASQAVTRISEMWRKIGARVILDHPERHDRIVGTVSHLPHIVAAALVESLATVGEHPDFQRALVGPGFLDMTRIAKGNPKMWADICRENREAILHSTDEFIRRLENWKKTLQDERYDDLVRKFKSTETQRKDLNDTSKTSLDQCTKSTQT